jgi:predicted aspartyl protease
MAGAVVSGCVAGRVPATSILINLADMPPAAPPGGDAGARLDTGADFSGRVTVAVKVNGQGPFNFVVDTGANRTVLSAELAQMLKLPDAGMAAIHGIAGVEPAPTALVRRLEVGAVASLQIRAPLLPRARLGADGLLGVDVLKNRRVSIDFGRNELRIGPSRNPETSAFDLRRWAAGDPDVPEPSSKRVVVPARYRFGQLIIIEADVGGLPVTAFLDSGSQNTVGNRALQRLVMGTNPDPRVRRFVVPLLSATGQTAQGELAALPTLRLGGLKLQGVMAVLADLHVFEIWDLASRPAILIGVDVMRSFDTVELDFGRRQVTFYLPSGRASTRNRPAG